MLVDYKTGSCSTTAPLLLALSKGVSNGDAKRQGVVGSRVDGIALALRGLRDRGFIEFTHVAGSTSRYDITVTNYGSFTASDAALEEEGVA